MVEVVNKYRVFKGNDGDFEAFIVGSFEDTYRLGIMRSGEIIDLHNYDIKTSSAYRGLTHIQWIKMKAFEFNVAEVWERKPDRAIIGELWSGVFQEDRLITKEEAERYLSESLNNKWSGNGYKVRFLCLAMDNDIVHRVLITKIVRRDQKLETFVGKCKIVGYSEDKILGMDGFKKMSGNIMENAGKFEMARQEYFEAEEVIKFHEPNKLQHKMYIYIRMGLTEQSIKLVEKALQRLLKFKRG